MIKEKYINEEEELEEDVEADDEERESVDRDSIDRDSVGVTFTVNGEETSFGSDIAKALGTLLWFVVAMAAMSFISLILMIVAFSGSSAKNYWPDGYGGWLAAAIICWLIGLWPVTFGISLAALCGKKKPPTESETGTESGTGTRVQAFNRNLKRLRK